MQTFSQTIHGESCFTDKQFAVLNPATEEVLAQAPAGTQAEIDKAVIGAQLAAKQWRNTSVTERLALLKKIAQVIKNNHLELARLLTQEQGKPLTAAQDEIEWSIEALKEAEHLQVYPDILQDDEDYRVEVRYQPLGVVGIIAPWNYPLYIAVNNILGSLICGNAAIVKPSPYTPLTTLRLGELIRDVVPAGLINIIAGGNDAGEWLTQHPGVAKINFTGSIATGQKIMAVAAQTLKRITLELGGNDPAIVLADADPVKIAHDIFWGAFMNSGQICVAIKRVYVHASLYRPLLDELLKIAKQVVVGNGLEENTKMGPLNNLAQLKRVEELVADARNHGAEILCGGARLERPGYFYPPTIVAEISEQARLVQEEQFGPALPVLPFHDIDDVIQRANATNMGLSASIWTTNLTLAAELANRLESGMVKINCLSTLQPTAPFGGAKYSGLGREGGRWTIDSMTEPMTVTIKK